MAVKKRLGEMLVEAGIIDETQLHAALGHQRQWGGRIGQVLVEMKLANEESIVDALAVKFGFEVARLDQLEPYAFEQARAIVPFDYAIRHSIFPIAADTGVLTVAMSDPTNLALTDELAFKSGRRIKVCIAGENAIAAALRYHAGEDQPAGREAIALDTDDDSSMEPIYDPIGATSSEALSSYYQQQTAIPVAPPPARPAPVAKAGTPPATRGATPAAVPSTAPSTARAAPPTTPAAPAVRAPGPPAPPKASPAVPPAAAPPAPPRATQAAPRAAPSNPNELQLEDQPTGSLALPPEATGSILLEPEPLTEEELQPIPLDGEPLGPGEEGDAASPDYAQGAGADYPPPAEYAQQPGDYPPPADYAQQPADYPPSADYAQQPGDYGQSAGEYAPAADPAEEYTPSEEEWVEGPVRPRELTAEESMILDELGRMAAGDEAAATIVRPAQLLATLIRLLIRKQLVTEQELLDEILRGG